jgi:AcrR family transcriptional regulator
MIAMTSHSHASHTPAQSPRDTIIDALMALAADMPFEQITLTHIAERAHLSLAELRTHFPSKGAILGGFTRRIDLIILNDTQDDLSQESAKDRLFDVLMRRLDAMTPYRHALKNIMQWIKNDPLTAAPLNGQIINSMRFMLEAAQLHAEGPMGPVILQAMSIKWAEVMDIWLHDQDEGLGPTMAALDHMLDDGSQWVERLSRFEKAASRMLNLLWSLPHKNKRADHHDDTRAHDDF